MILSEEQMRQWIFSSIAKFKTRFEASKVLGIPQAYLNDILHGRREISEEVAKKFGFERDVVFINDSLASPLFDKGIPKL